MLRVGDAEDAIFEMGEVVEAKRRAEKTLGDQLQRTASYAAGNRRESRRAHALFVVKDAHDLVVLAGEYGLRDVGQAARDENAAHLVERGIEKIARDVMQRLEHQHQVDAVVVERQGFSAAGDE